MNGVIYQIQNKINSKRYIGQTSNKYPNSRWSAHKWAAKTGDKKPLYNSIRKYGEEYFTFEILEDLKVSELSEVEIQLIKKFRTLWPNGYNLTPGGEALRGKHNPMFGKTPWNKGIPRTKEVKEKVSKANAGKQGLCGKDNPRFGKPAYNRGVPATDDSRKKSRLAQKNCKKTIMFMLDSNKTKEFNSLGEASEWVRNNTTFKKADYSTIRKSIKNNWKAYGYSWRFK